MTRLLGLVIFVATVILVTVGTLWPNDSGVVLGGSGPRLLRPTSPQAAVENLLGEISRHDWQAAYNSLANKAEFSEPEFERDLSGSYGSLRVYARLDGFELQPLHATADEAQFRAYIRWSTVVGSFQDVRVIKTQKEDNRWIVIWPLVKEARVPPQVIPVNYLRWDVIYRGPEDDWGAQDVEAPHVRIVDMHPIDRGDGVVVLGEILNEDVVPAYVTVKATLLRKDGSAIATEDAFDKMSHVLLPKQVSPFRIDFRRVRLSQVDSVQMNPSSSLVGASADPVIEIEGQKLNPLPQPSLSGQLINQSGQVVSIAHVLGTFYDKNGQLVWVADHYADRALLPQTPESFAIAIPPDLESKVATYRVITNTYSADQFR